MTRRHTISFIRIATVVLAIAMIGGYSLFNFRIFIAGPQISINNPINGSTISDSPLVKIEGIASNISMIELNDGAISIDEEGNFSESVLLHEGYNTFKIEAKDKFGREITRDIRLFFNGQLAVYEPPSETEALDNPEEESEILDEFENEVL